MRFKEINGGTNTEWLNDSEDYFLILQLFYDVHITPTGTSGQSTRIVMGAIQDTDGNTTGYFNQEEYENIVVAGSLSDEVFQYAVNKHYNARIVPPHFKIKFMAYGYGVFLTEPELEQVILNGGGY